MDAQALVFLRSAMRKDLTSLGVIPTAVGIQMVAQTDPALGFALVCEAVFVQLYNARPVEAILAYLEGPLQIGEPQMRQYILLNALRVRAALSAAAGDADVALRTLMTDARAEQAVIEKVIEACVRTAGEFQVPWTTVYFPTYRPHHPRARRAGCAILSVIVLALVYGLYRLIRHLTG